MPDVKTTPSLPTPTQAIQPGGATASQANPQQVGKSTNEEKSSPQNQTGERQKEIIQQIQALVEQSKSPLPSSNPPLKIPQSESPSEKKKEQVKLLQRVGDIIKQHGGAEANIPLTSEYWDLLNRYRSLNY
jgi:hypothetical protein